MKKFKYNILKYAIVAGVLATPFVATSCRQELDINTDPNNPSNASISGLLSGSQIGLGYILGGEARMMPAAIMQYYAGHRGQPLDHAQYKITSSSTSGPWQYLYNSLMDMKEMETKAAASGDQVYVGISKIMQAHTFSVLTDLFGDIPFSQALKGREDITPEYDTQQNIYPQLITMLEEGATLVKSGTGNNPGSADLVYGGDVAKWEKFANSLKLRLLNHQSKKDANAAATFLATNPALIDTYSDNAQVLFGTSSTNANPVYQLDILSGRKDQAVATTIVDKMKSLSDPRVSVYFKAVVNNGDGLQGQILGNTPGNDTDDSGESLYSRVGSAYASVSSPVVLMSAAEVNFIKAEVYQRAGNTAAAKTAYEAAITQDFLALGLSASSYLSNANVAYNNTLERIMEQKWITMYQAPHESWVDWRRTGYPALTVPATNYTKDVTPRRLPYPTVEINVNGANLAAGPGIPVPYVTILKPVWWDQ